MRSGNIDKSVLNIALVEKKTTTDIKAGENGGATLTNYNVVRNFKTINKIENGINMSVNRYSVISRIKKYVGCFIPAGKKK